MSESVSPDMIDTLAFLRRMADAAYLKYSDMLDSDLCRGTAAKLDAGKFKWENLQQFCRAHEELGRHRALYEVLTVLDRRTEGRSDE